MLKTKTKATGAKLRLEVKLEDKALCVLRWQRPNGCMACQAHTQKHTKHKLPPMHRSSPSQELPVAGGTEWLAGRNCMGGREAVHGHIVISSSTLSIVIVHHSHSCVSVCLLFVVCSCLFVYFVFGWLFCFVSVIMCFFVSRFLWSLFLCSFVVVFPFA
jgi:hypothetical protein